MKKVVLRNWVKKVLTFVSVISFMFIATTLESDYTSTYIMLLLSNMFAFVVSAFILYKFS